MRKPYAAADWYRSSLSEPKAEPDDNGAHEPDAPRMAELDETTSIKAPEATPSPG